MLLRIVAEKKRILIKKIIMLIAIINVKNLLHTSSREEAKLKFWVQTVTKMTQNFILELQIVEIKQFIYYCHL